MASPRKTFVAVVAAAFLVAGCTHWWQRGLITMTATTSEFAVLGAVFPCPYDSATGQNTPCKKLDRAVEGGTIGVAAGLVFWAILEIYVALRAPDDDTPHENESDDESSGDEPDGSGSASGSGTCVDDGAPHHRCGRVVR